MRRKIPRAPSALCPKHVRGSAVLVGIEQSLRVPVGEIATIDLKVSDAVLSGDGHSVTVAHYRTAWVILIRGFRNSELVPIAFQLSDCGCVFPFRVGPEDFDSIAEIGRSVVDHQRLASL